jgi:hypothetical protein
MDKWCDVWMIEPYSWHEPMIAETRDEAMEYAKQWIIKEYELSPEAEISEKYYNHRQRHVFWVEGVNDDANLIEIKPISWAQ